MGWLRQLHREIAGTGRALLAPRRLGPILIVALPIIYVQERELSASPVGLPYLVASVAGLVLVATLAYRRLLSASLPPQTRVPRFLMYSALGGVAPLVIAGLPVLVGLPPFVTTEPTVLVSAGLFWVAGYGLGRDIELERRAQALSQQAAHAQALALRTHLDPHFLFNTLNAIAEWCREDPEVAERALIELSGLLRLLLVGVRTPKWPLERELRAVRGLFELHRIRDPSRFSIEWSVPDGPSVLVPPLLLLPLAENAMTHGPGKGHEGPVRLSTRIDGPMLELVLTNPGPFQGWRSGGEGLRSVEERLELAYGRAGQLVVRGVEPSGTEAIVRWPMEPAEGPSD